LIAIFIRRITITVPKIKKNSEPIENTSVIVMLEFLKIKPTK